MTTPNPKALAPCPFCGHASSPKLTDSREFQDDIDGCFDETNDVCYAIVCDASKPGGPGGCGGMSRFASKPEQAIAAWNTRTAVAAASRVVHAPAPPDHDHLDDDTPLETGEGYEQ